MPLPVRVSLHEPRWFDHWTESNPESGLYRGNPGVSPAFKRRKKAAMASSRRMSVPWATRRPKAASSGATSAMPVSPLIWSKRPTWRPSQRQAPRRSSQAAL